MKKFLPIFFVASFVSATITAQVKTAPLLKSKHGKTIDTVIVKSKANTRSAARKKPRLRTEAGPTLQIGKSADLSGIPVPLGLFSQHDDTSTSGVVLGNMFRENFMAPGTQTPQGLENYLKLSGGDKGSTIGIVSNIEWSGTSGTLANAIAVEGNLAVSSTGNTNIKNVVNFYAPGVGSKGAASGATITDAYEFFGNIYSTRGIKYINKHGIYIVDSTADNYFAGTVGTGGPLIVKANTYFSGSSENSINTGYSLPADALSNKGELWVNFKGYNDGFAYYRNFIVGDGKGRKIAWFQGSTGSFFGKTEAPGANNDAMATTAYVDKNLEAAPTVTSGSISGTAAFNEPIRATYYKKIIVYCNSLAGRATYTFPVAFTNLPIVSVGAKKIKIETLSTTKVTISANSATGELIFEGY